MDKEITLIEEWFISDEQLHQVFAVGLVDSPAIEVNWKKFSKTKVEKFSIDKAKRILTGPLAIPNLEIYRSNPDRYVYFSEETIAKLSENFFKYSHQNTTTHNHIFNIPGNTVIESWLVEDPETDKSKALGYTLPKGTWMISVKVQDEKYWNEFIETGILKGFSLEGNFDDKVIQMNEQKDLGETPKKKRKNKWRNSMKKLLEFIKSMNFSADQTVADITEELEAASLLMAFNEGERAIEIDNMFIGTYMDDMSFVTEGEHTVTNPDMTADYILMFGAEGKLLNFVTPWGLGMDTTEEVVETETELEVVAEMNAEKQDELDSLKIENKNLEVKIAELTTKIEQMSKQTNKPIEVKNTVDKSKKVEEKTYQLSGTLSRIKNNNK